MTNEEFYKTVIAQDDDCDYSESGYVAGVLPDGTAYLAYYSHCSCYGTWTSICGGDWAGGGSEPNWLWRGSIESLVDMARRIADPAMPDRAANENDYDHDHLVAVYNQILEWNSNRIPALIHPDNTPNI